MTTTNTDRETALENLRKARERMAAFIRTTTGANIAEATIIRGTIVIGGSWPEITVCAAYLAHTLEIKGITVDEVDAEDPDYTFLRIPDGALETALERAQTKTVQRVDGGRVVKVNARTITDEQIHTLRARLGSEITDEQIRELRDDLNRKHRGRAGKSRMREIMVHIADVLRGEDNQRYRGAYANARAYVVGVYRAHASEHPDFRARSTEGK